MLLPLFLSHLSIGRSKPIPQVPVYLYKAYGGKISRRFVKQIDTVTPSPKNPFSSSAEKGEPRQTLSKILNIPLYASFNKFYKMILSRGPKIAESLKQFKEKGKYPFSLSQRMIGRRRGSLVGRRVKTISSSRHGRYVCYRFPQKKPWDVALAPTIRAAAPFQAQRKRENLLVAIRPQDIRVKMREVRTPLTILLLLDMSESMASSLDNVRNAVVSMHDFAYKKRDRVAMVVFKGSGATVLQSPTTNLNLVEKKLLDVGTSDFTPLAAGMLQAWRVLRNEKLRNKDMIPVLIVVSDGIANVPLDRPLSPFTRIRYMNASQADVIDVAGFLQRVGIRTIVINTAHEKEGEALTYLASIEAATSRRLLSPTNLLLEIPRITGGYYYGIGEGGKIESTVLMDAFTIMDREPPKASL
jgi:Mg-chelatase subunit ChlD